MTASIHPLHPDERRRRARRRARGSLDVAEDLWGRRGMEGASLREIAAAAGQRNNSAVRYHFRDKAGLVDALLADRMTRVEAIRANASPRESPNMARSTGSLDHESPEVLLRLMWQPMLDLASPGSPHSFVRFMLAFLIDLTGHSHPLVARLQAAPRVRRYFACSPRLLSAAVARAVRIPYRAGGDDVLGGGVAARPGGRGGEFAMVEPVFARRDDQAEHRAGGAGLMQTN